MKSRWMGLTVLYGLLGPAGAMFGQTAATPGSGGSGDVVILALGSLRESEATHLTHTTREIVGGAAVNRSLRDIQMSIVQNTVGFGPVILLTADEETKSYVVTECAKWKLCAAIDSGRIQLKTVTHEGPWIRDYGPQIDAASNKAKVVHWGYRDTRQDEAVDEVRTHLAKMRLGLIKEALNTDDDESDLLSLDEKEMADDRAMLDRKISLLGQLDGIYANKALFQRNVDERSAFEVAQAVLADPNFEYAASTMFVDGGNLLRMGDGRCLTTATLLARNKDATATLREDLTQKGGCGEVIFLEPLPGPVIEHVDMFVLPVGPKTMLLASYDLNQEYVRKYWPDLTAEQQQLVFDAALAMRKNSRRLRALGYTVIDVPAPLPVDQGHGKFYYPTVLNALVRTDGNGGTQVLVPVYDDYQDDVQKMALQMIRSAFGASAQIVSIDSTQAAKLQGAVHCLTLTLPRSISIFEDSKAEDDRRVLADAKRDLNRLVKKQTDSLNLSGTWDGFEDIDDAMSQAPPEYRVIFTEDEVSLTRVGSGREIDAKYSVKSRNGKVWKLTLKGEGGEGEVEVRWLTSGQLELQFVDSRVKMVLRRQAVQGSGGQE